MIKYKFFIYSKHGQLLFTYSTSTEINLFTESYKSCFLS